MTKSITKSKKGFTIIEVVLVLAIAGLIFLMVFVALPALQRSQRDTQRRDDMARVATAINQYQTNNNGRVPMAMATVPTSADFINRYLGGNNEFRDPDGTDYTIVFGTFNGKNSTDPNKASNQTLHTVYVYNRAACEGETMVAADNNNEYAILTRLEGSGIYCADNR